VIYVYLGAGFIRNVMTAGLVFLVAHIMQVGLTLQEEQSLTI